jgi:predicted PurR-regulated permease PerM
MQSDSATQRRTTTFLNVAAGAAVTLGMIVLLLLLWYVRSLVLLTFLAVLFGVTLARGVDHLERWKLPRAAGAAAIVLVLIGAFWGLGVWLAPTISEQAKEIRRGLPAAVDKLEAWINRQPLVNVALGGREAVRSGGQQTAATPDAARANDVPSAEDGSANAGGRASVPQQSRASLSRRLNE